MATIHRLNSDWSLTDGIIEPIRLDRPADIYSALRTAQLIPDAHYGLNSLACEWIYNRTFVYEKTFDLPPANDTERMELHFETIFGSNFIVTVNDEPVVKITDCIYDITRVVRETGNTLKVFFPPNHFTEGQLLKTRGISGSVYIAGTNRITLQSVAFSKDIADDDTDILLCELAIHAHISGKYHFTCVLARDGEAVATYDQHKRLIAAEQFVLLEFPLPKHAEGLYTVQLTIELNGLLCDRVREVVFLPSARPPEAICTLDPDDFSEETVLAVLPQLRAAGFDAVAFKGRWQRTQRIRTRMQELDLSEAEDCASFSSFGIMHADMLRRYADRQRCWPMTTPVWKLRRDGLPNQYTLAREIGDIDSGNMDQMTSAIRLQQAQQVFQAIIHARKAGIAACIHTEIRSFPHFAGHSLFDMDIPRPALYAAKQALQPLIAVADVPDGTLPTGEVLKLPVLLLSRRDVKPLPVTVTATMYDIDGHIISGTSFSALPGGEMRLGELNCELPADLRCALLRTTVERPGEEPVITDRFIPCGTKPMMPADLPCAAEDGFRYGVVTSTGIRHLLPGETAEGCTGEYFNR